MVAVRLVVAIAAALLLCVAHGAPDELPMSPSVCNMEGDMTWPGAFTGYPGYNRVETSGEMGTLEYSIQFRDAEDAPMSPWHDIPLGLEEVDGSYFIWVVNEIPKGEMAKMETMTKEEYNPIMQDDETVEDADGNELYDRPRYYGYGPSLVNYGSIPQTWEDISTEDADTGEVGDGDPIDSLEIGSAVAPMGAVYRVKVLGAIALMDGGETDWKIVVINDMDPLAAEYSDVFDVPAETLEGIYTWFRDYKTADGKDQLAYWPGDESIVDTYFGVPKAVEVLQRGQAAWERLLSGECQEEDCLEIWTGSASADAGR